MKLTWIGHSCFKVEKDGFVTMIDPCEDGSVPDFCRYKRLLLQSCLYRAAFTG